MSLLLWSSVLSVSSTPFDVTSLFLETGISPRSWSKYNGTKQLNCTSAIPRDVNGSWGELGDLYSFITTYKDNYPDLTLFEHKLNGTFDVCKNFSVTNETYNAAETTVWWRCDTGGSHAPTFAPTHLPTPVQDDASFGPLLSYDEALAAGVANNNSLFYNTTLVHENFTDWVLARYTNNGSCDGTLFIRDGTYNQFIVHPSTVVNETTPHDDPHIINWRPFLDFAYGYTVAIQVGDTVTWQVPQNSVADMDVVSGYNVFTPTGLFDSGNLVPGDNFSYTFNESGSFYYHSKRNDKGIIVVFESTENTHLIPWGETDNTDYFLYNTSLTIPVGHTVMWIIEMQFFTDKSVVSGTPGNTTGLFDSGSLDFFQNFSYTFQDAGTFEYFNSLNTSMTGTITVIENKITKPFNELF